MCAGPGTALADTTTGSNVGGDVAGFGPGVSVGQSFTVPGPDTFLHSLTINGFNTVSGTSHIKVTTVDGSGFPTGTVLYTSPTIPVIAGPVPLTVYPNITVSAGTQYAFYIEPDTLAGGLSPVDSPSDVYAGGALVTRPNPPGTTWAVGPGAHDIAFLASFNTGNMETFTTVSCPGTGKVGQAAACTATLKDGNGIGVNGKSLALSNFLTGGGFTPCVVDAAGNCSFNFTPTVAGPDTVFAQFTGATSYLPNTGGSTLITVSKRTSGQSAAGCTPAILHVGETTTCSVTVSDTDTGTKTSPTGVTSWSSTGAGTFAGGGACSLTPQPLGVSKCLSISYTPTAPGAASITSAYAGDASHLASATASAGTLTVLPAAAPPGPSATGQRAAALKKCKKKHSKKKRKKCRKKARNLPV
jgi:hypothetical protein